MSFELELKKKKLINLQLCGLLQVTQENQSYVSMLNRGVLGKLENVIISNKHESEHVDLKRKTTKSDMPEETPLGKGPRVLFEATSLHKPLLTKEIISNIAPIIVPWLKSLISNLEVQHEDINTIDEFDEKVNIPLKVVDDYEDGLLEKNMMMTKALQFVKDPNGKIMTYNVNALAIVKENHREFATIEVSGGLMEQDHPHTLGDTMKTLLEESEML
ncbi:6806_t:CDS:2 [Funneliformis geosporum]|nr:6806_t:CDS:2 [Funneliformis geosporum]